MTQALEYKTLNGQRCRKESEELGGEIYCSGCSGPETETRGAVSIGEADVCSSALLSNAAGPVMMRSSCDRLHPCSNF